MILVDELRELRDREVDVRCVQRPDFLPRRFLPLHREFRIEREMHIRALQVWEKRLELRRDSGLAYLYVEYEEVPLGFGELRHALDQRIGHSRPPQSLRPRASLRDRRDHLQRANHGHRGVGALECVSFGLQAREHLRYRQLTENAHALGERVAVIGDDPATWQHGARERSWWSRECVPGDLRDGERVAPGGRRVPSERDGVGSRRAAVARPCSRIDGGLLL